MRSSRRLLPVALVALSGTWISAPAIPGAPSPQGRGGGAVQNQRPGPPGTIRVRVRMVPVDVVVTDRNDRPVRDLRREDFQILENGRPQEIRHFSVQTFTAAVTEAAPAPAVPQLPPAELAPQTARTFLILMGRGRHQRIGAVDDLIRFVRSELLPQDRVAVFAYNRATDFTTDHKRIEQVLESYKKNYDKIEAALESRLRGLAVIYGSKEIPASCQADINHIFEQAGVPASRQVPPATAETTNATRDGGRTNQILQHGLAKELADTAAEPGKSIAATENEMMAMEALRGSIPFDEWAPLNSGSIQDMQNLFTCIEYMRYMEGEKHLLFFTEEGLFFPFGNASNDSAIARVASDARVAIDTFQTGGIRLDMGIRRGGVNLRNTPLSSPGRDYALASLRTISQLTGGRSAIYSDIGGSLKRVNDATRVTYLLGYYPSNNDWDGKYRRIAVKVNRPGLKVSFRHGYFARDTLQPYDREEFRTYSRVTAAGGYTQDIGDIPFRITTTPVPDPGGPSRLKVDLDIDAAGIGFSQVNDRHVARLRIVVFYADHNGRYLGEDAKTMDLQLREESYRLMAQAGIPFSTTILLSDPRPMLKIVVYDMGSDKVGSRLVKIK